MITVVEGRPGTGKTIFLVQKILSYLNAGHHVYTNVSIFLKPTDIRMHQLHYITSLQDITNVREGKIVLDEVQTYLNSRLWDKLDVKFQLLLQQHRKRGLDILGATQSVKRADVIFRELVHYFYTVQKLFIIPFMGHSVGLFLLRQYDADATEVDKTERDKWRIGWVKPMVVTPYTFALYNTNQEVAIQEEIGRIEVIRRLIVENPKNHIR